jgi:hypothetical protein
VTLGRTPEDDLLTEVTEPRGPSVDPAAQPPQQPHIHQPLTRRELRERERAAAAAAAHTEQAALTEQVALTEPAALTEQPAFAEPAALTEPAPPAIPAVRPPRPIPLATSTRHHHAHGTHKRKSKRAWFSGGAMIAAAGLVTTLSLPAYAYQTDHSDDGSRATASQSLTVHDIKTVPVTRDAYTTIENVAAWDSTTGNTVPATVQKLAASLMADVASGKLSGSVPDHIPEIRNLAEGVAVPGCGIDYRVLQVIKVAVDNFNTVGVSDINRRCTGQIEGAGAASAHYADGGGHAVDFDMLNGHGLSGGDAESLQLIAVLDPLVPAGTHVGQMQCRSSVPMRNLVPFDDSCTHLHIDFGSAVGTSLRE